MKYLFVFILIVCIWGFPASSQKDLTYPPDSLLALLPEYKSEEDRLDLHLRLARSYQKQNPEKALKHAQIAYDFALELDLEEKQLEASEILGYSHYRLGNFKEALPWEKKILSFYQRRGDSMKVAGAHDNLAQDYYYLDNYGLALRNYLKALVIYQELEERDKIASLYNNIGLLYRKQMQYYQAQEYFLKALETTHEGEQDLFRSFIYNNLANLYVDMQELQKAEEVQLRALKLRRNLEDVRYISRSMLNLGMIYVKQGRYDEAVKTLRESITRLKEAGDEHALGVALHNLGEAYLGKGETEKALSSLQESLELSKGSGSLSATRETYHLLADAAAASGSEIQALGYRLKEYQYSDSISQLEKEQELARLQTQFETEQKEQEIALLQKENELASVWRNLLIGGLALAFIIVLLIIWNYRIRMRKNREILKRQTELHHKQEELQKAELEKSQLKEKQLALEVEHKSQQLTTHTLNIIQKNKLLEELQLKLEELQSSNGQSQQKLQEIRRFINFSLDIDRDWEEFRSYFDQVNNNFFRNLKMKYPELSPSELRLAALVRLNMSIKEAASVLNISPGSVKTARYRLRKKLDLDADIDLNEFLVTY